jgi:hypothetical protein
MLIPFIKGAALHNEVTHSPIGKDLFYQFANTTGFPAFPPRVGFAQVVGALGEDVVGPQDGVQIAFHLGGEHAHPVPQGP